MNDQEYESLRRYLTTEDERERANRQVEVAKRLIQRNAAKAYVESRVCTRCLCNKSWSPDGTFCKECATAIGAAIERGDSGSPVEPVVFVQVAECRICQDPLWETSRSPVMGICRYCLKKQTEDAILHAQEQIRRATKPASQWWAVAAWCGLIFVFAPMAVWVIGAVIFRLAGG